MWKQINPELYRNDNGQAMMIRRDKDNKACPFFIDDSNPDLAIPIIDFLEKRMDRIKNFHRFASH